MDFLAQLFPNAFPIELVQLASALIALPLLLWALINAVNSERRRRIAGENGQLSYLAKGNALRGSFRVAKAILFVVAGIYSVRLGPPHRHAVPIGADLVISTEAELAEEKKAIEIVRTCVIGATILLMMDAATERWFRIKITGG